MYKVKTSHVIIRLFSTKVAPKNVKSSKLLKEYKITQDIVEHFTKLGQQDILEKFPPKLLRKKHKFPESYYIASKEAAEIIGEYLIKSRNASRIIVESNPGTGMLTSILTQSYSKLHLFESNDTFYEKLKEKYADGNKQVKIEKGDLVNMWKLGFQDRQDNGMRVHNLLSSLPVNNWSSKPMQLFAAVGSLNFFKYLIYSIVRQGDLFTNGRLEMFLVLPPPLYIHLTCSNEAGYQLYRANTILFQIMFEYTYLTKIPRKLFVPWQYDQSSNKRIKLNKIYAIDSEYLYLVKICPRANIYEMCPQEYMQALVYFVKQSYTSRKHRVIPLLEKWAPGCGPRLIVQPEPSCPMQPLHRNFNHELPKYSTLCTTISDKDFCPNMNIFTEFGDLGPSQMLTLFSQFRSWPEFRESTFLASLENSLLKMETSDQETLDTIALQEEEEFTSTESEAKNLLNKKKS